MDAPNRGLSIVIGVCIVVITAVLAKIFLFGNKMIYPNLQLADILIDEPVLNLKETDNKCSSYSLKSTFNWRGRFGILIKKLVDFSFGVSIEDCITSKCGQLLLREIEHKGFTSAIKDRKLKLNMEHSLVKEIKKAKAVLCVVNGVVIASDEIQIKETRKRDFKIKLAWKSSDTEPADCGADVSTEPVMVINPGITLGYKVWELVVKEVNGHIEPVLTEYISGGFIPKEIQKNGSDKPDNGDQPPPNDGKANARVFFNCVGGILGLCKKNTEPNNGDPSPPSDRDPPPPSHGDPPPPSHGDPPPPSHGDPPPPTKKSLHSDEPFRFELLPESSGECSHLNAMMLVLSNGQFRFELLPEFSGRFSHHNDMLQEFLKVQFRFKLLPESSGGFSQINAMKSVQSDEQFRFEILPEYIGGILLIFAMKSVKSDEQFRFEMFPEYIGGFFPIFDMLQEFSEVQFRLKPLPEFSGGFSHLNVEDNVAELLKDFKNILQPLHDCAKAEDEHIKYSLLVLMTCSSDVLALSKILSKAEDGCLNEDKDTLDKQFINNETVWSILTHVGVQTGDGRVLCEGKATPILTAVSYMIDAILELDNDFLNIIYDCDEQQLKTLLEIFESAVASSTATSVDVDMSSVLKEPVSSFLTRLKFTVYNNSIHPPKAKTCIVECIFCVLYCLL